ncbi:hypothetical protein PR048_025031 [Dryococelus australis]|uniref:Uncharacterized protein n=1 Tax=Dryococelus australis TaxID=614101 RepID=A0ABQ9GQ84_9NEOP|nr:hypothetical protein PR048_025031 [Dryococelus australis]
MGVFWWVAWLRSASCLLYCRPAGPNRSSLRFRRTAADTRRLACSPPTNQTGPLPDFRILESGRTVPLVSGFSRGSPVPPVLPFRRCSILTSITLIGSQDLACYVGNTARLARRSDGALDVRVSVAHIAIPPLDLERGGPSSLRLTLSLKDPPPAAHAVREVLVSNPRQGIDTISLPPRRTGFDSQRVRRTMSLISWFSQGFLVFPALECQRFFILISLHEKFDAPGGGGGEEAAQVLYRRRVFLVAISFCRCPRQSSQRRPVRQLDVNYRGRNSLAPGAIVFITRPSWKRRRRWGWLVRWYVWSAEGWGGRRARGLDVTKGRAIVTAAVGPRVGRKACLLARLFNFSVPALSVRRYTRANAITVAGHVFLEKEIGVEFPRKGEGGLTLQGSFPRKPADQQNLPCTVPTCENLAVTPPGIEPGTIWLEANAPAVPRTQRLSCNRREWRVGKREIPEKTRRHAVSSRHDSHMRKSMDRPRQELSPYHLGGRRAL